MNNNSNINIRFVEAKKCASELMDNLEKMKEVLNTLEEKINNMTWQGSNASKFKESITKIKEELDTIYRTQIAQIPEKIEATVNKYQQFEQ